MSELLIFVIGLIVAGVLAAFILIFTLNFGPWYDRRIYWKWHHWLFVISFMIHKHYINKAWYHAKRSLTYQRLLYDGLDPQPELVEFLTGIKNYKYKENEVINNE